MSKQPVRNSNNDSPKTLPLRKAFLFVTSTAVGWLASVAVFKLAALFGIASTGTAIAALSGAAATSATLAFIGGTMTMGIVALVLTACVVAILFFKVMSKKIQRL
ncbi:hypothetical protein [Agarivorans sp. DSG3-1]|uniref:hypothetical protein n=1 Tax=Agarivorans sp. DSG3-1 TaxID=3342249 RepID=UPI00398E327E